MIVLMNFWHLVDWIDVREAFHGAPSNVNKITQVSSQNRSYHENERWIGYNAMKNCDKSCALREGLDSCILEMYVEMAH